MKDRASDVFRAHVRVNPFPEEDHEVLLEWLRPEHLLFGSDWPHPEGIAEPRSYPELPARRHHARSAAPHDARQRARELLGLATES